jgi:hypothetical protein
MGSQDEQINTATSIANTALQQVSNYCTITCNNDISNLDITIIGGESTVNIEQTCSIMGSECMIKSLLQTQISNLISNILKQTQSNLGIFSLIGPGMNESVNISNAIKNQISQIITNSCIVADTQTITNTSVFAQDADTTLNFIQNGNINKASCALDTVTKLVLNNSVLNNVDQNQSSCGDILTILLIIGIIAIVIILFPLISAVIGVAARGIRGAGRIIPVGDKNKK